MPLSRHLIHARLKAARALEHLNQLEGELEAFRNDEPVKVTIIRKPEIGRRFIRVDTKDLPDRLYLLVGDFVHNLRSVLDHIVWSLATYAAQALPSSTAIQWPVLAVPNPKTLARQTAGIDPAAVTLIETWQPYHAGPDPAYKGHPLWHLHRLDIIDKHRRIAINESIVEAYFPTLTKASDMTRTSGDGYFEVGFPIDAPQIPMHYNRVPVIHFGAAEEDLVVTPKRLNEMYQLVTTDLLPKFDVFFSES